MRGNGGQGFDTVSTRLPKVMGPGCAMKVTDSYLEKFKGGFTGILRWRQLDELWKTLFEDADGDWYIYRVMESPPALPADGHQLKSFVEEIDALLRKEHKETYCGIVYADNVTHPEFVKIYDPNNLGMACGSSARPPLPGWTLSKAQPVSLPDTFPPPTQSGGWLSKLFQYRR